MNWENEFEKSTGLSVYTVEKRTVNQLTAFQKLIEWHFDLFDGIKNKEAIDVNTLDINPYK